MAESDNRREHTQIKLELYRRYLQSYLLVLRHIRNINVFDIFAGGGVDKNDQKGSALIAAEEIDIARKVGNSKNISLRLNDADKEKYKSLLKNLERYSDFVSVKNVKADEYIKNHLGVANNANNLFFIDPYGYTQILQANFKKLLAIPKSDFLIFIPLSSINRFRRKPNDPNAPHYKSIAKFRNIMNISSADIENVEKFEDFVDIIKESFRRLVKADYVYYQVLKSSRGANKYGLFFICRHVLGAEKFLEAQEKGPHEKIIQYELALRQSIRQFIDSNQEYNNVDLYEIGIKNSILPKSLNKELEEMEEGGKIEVSIIQGKTRRAKKFYIGYNYFKDNERRIFIKVKK